MAKPCGKRKVLRLHRGESRNPANSENRPQTHDPKWVLLLVFPTILLNPLACECRGHVGCSASAAGCAAGSHETWTVTSVRPEQSHGRPQILKRPVLFLVLCCHQLKALLVYKQSRTFSSHAGLANHVACPAKRTSWGAEITQTRCALFTYLTYNILSNN